MEIRARIVGFSDRIPSIMVPESFLKWANERYGSEPDPAPSRLIIQVGDAADPALSTFLQQKNYETNRDRLRRSRTAAAARIAVIVTGAVSLLIAGLSVLLAAMNAQLLISRSASALSLLVHLGYGRAFLIRWLLLKHAALLAASLVLALALYKYGLSCVHKFFIENGLIPPSPDGRAAYLVLFVFAGTAFILQLLAVRGSLVRATGTVDEVSVSG
jgi:hypothetical protein